MEEKLDRLNVLEKALLLAGDKINDWIGECPGSRCVYLDENDKEIDMTDFFDCENCTDNYSECWKKHFIRVAERCLKVSDE